MTEKKRQYSKELVYLKNQGYELLGTRTIWTRRKTNYSDAGVHMQVEPCYHMTKAAVGRILLKKCKIL
jgi:hypothetical protein